MPGFQTYDLIQECESFSIGSDGLLRTDDGAVYPHTGKLALFMTSRDSRVLDDSEWVEYELRLESGSVCSVVQLRERMNCARCNGTGKEPAENLYPEEAGCDVTCSQCKGNGSADPEEEK